MFILHTCEVDKKIMIKSFEGISEIADLSSSQYFCSMYVVFLITFSVKLTNHILTNYKIQNTKSTISNLQLVIVSV